MTMVALRRGLMLVLALALHQRPAGAAPAAADHHCRTENYACHSTPELDLVAKATVRIELPTTTGIKACTGTLLNNASRRNLVLTSKHCQEDPHRDSGPVDAAFLEFVWAVQSPCDSTDHSKVDSPGEAKNRTETLLTRGARHLAEWQDMWLVELLDPPPAAAGAWYLGYDASDQVPQSISVIHHGLRLARQLLVRDRPTRHNLGDDPGNPVNRFGAGSGRGLAEWELLTEGLGLMTPGGSGAAMVNEHGKLVGAISGVSSCASIAGGRFGVAWQRAFRPYFPDRSMTGQPHSPVH